MLYLVYRVFGFQCFSVALNIISKYKHMPYKAICTSCKKETSELVLLVNEQRVCVECYNKMRKEIDRVSETINHK